MAKGNFQSINTLQRDKKPDTAMNISMQRGSVVNEQEPVFIVPEGSKIEPEYHLEPSMVVPAYTLAGISSKRRSTPGKLAPEMWSHGTFSTAPGIEKSFRRSVLVSACPAR